MPKLLFFVLPLGLDSFAVAAAIGAAGAPRLGQRLRVSLVFVLFEGGMPLVGLGLGGTLATGIGQVANPVAAAAVAAVGTWMLLAGGDDDQRADRVLRSHGLALVMLGISISLDELAIGFTIGLVRLPVVPVVVALAVQAFLAAQLGLALGATISQRLRERAVRAAGLALILLGAYLLAEQLGG